VPGVCSPSALPFESDERDDLLPADDVHQNTMSIIGETPHAMFSDGALFLVGETSSTSSGSATANGGGESTPHVEAQIANGSSARSVRVGVVVVSVLFSAFYAAFHPAD